MCCVQGWEQFTEAAIAKLSQQRSGLVFLLWGRFAQVSLTESKAQHSAAQHQSRMYISSGSQRAGLPAFQLVLVACLSYHLPPGALGQQSTPVFPCSGHLIAGQGAGDLSQQAPRAQVCPPLGALCQPRLLWVPALLPGQPAAPAGGPATHRLADRPLTPRRGSRSSRCGVDTASLFRHGQVGC